MVFSNPENILSTISQRSHKTSLTNMFPQENIFPTCKTMNWAPVPKFSSLNCLSAISSTIQECWPEKRGQEGQRRDRKWPCIECTHCHMKSNCPCWLYMGLRVPSHQVYPFLPAVAVLQISGSSLLIFCGFL